VVERLRSSGSVAVQIPFSMADETDVLLQLYAEERAQARQSETQRATLTNIVIIVAGASIAFISDQKLGNDALTLSIGIFVLGVFGAIANAKYFERWYRHWARAYAYRARLLALYPVIDEGLRQYSNKRTYKRTDKYEAEADERFWFSRRVKLYLLWVGLNCLIALGGVLLTVIILVK
jgi:hypothetical protein